jgi:hypothetical protein
VCPTGVVALRAFAVDCMCSERCSGSTAVMFCNAKTRAATGCMTVGTDPEKDVFVREMDCVEVHVSSLGGMKDQVVKGTVACAKRV